jgi:hypothetical protein
MELGVEIVQAMAAKDSIFQELQRTEEDYWQRPEARYFLLRERLAEMDRMAEIDDARAEGEAIGEARGDARGETRERLKTARSLLLEKAPIDMIQRVTGLSKEEISSLQ